MLINFVGATYDADHYTKYKIETYLQWKTNRKLYVAYRNSVTYNVHLTCVIIPPVGIHNKPIDNGYYISH